MKKCVIASSRVRDYGEHGRTFPSRRANAGPDQNYYGFQIFLGKVRPLHVNGITLAQLMVTHNIGVQDRETYVIKRVDEDFFEEA